jgi:hypothetical protein
VTDRLASRREHQRFCEIEGWTEVLNARGKPTQHHITYELLLGDGQILRTRISRPANTDIYGKSLWAHILNDQLYVTAETFWQCVDNKHLPDRTPATEKPDTKTLPASLAYQLVNTLHLTNEQIEALTIEVAVQRMTEYWAQPPP